MPILEPRVTMSIVPASQTTGLLEQRVLLVGQMLDTGTATAGTLVEEIGNDNAENTLFGQRSHLSSMVKDFKKINKTTQLDAICLADAGDAIQSYGATTFSGTATETGTYYISVASEYNYTVEIDVSIGDTATEVGDAIETAFTALTDAPFTAFNNAGAVTYTAANGGTHANDWPIKVKGTVAGLSYVITPWAYGASDPTLTDVLDVIDNIRYRTVVWPSSYSLTTIEALLNARFNSDYVVMDGVAIQTINGTMAECKAYANQNSQSICIFGNKTVSQTDRSGAAIMEMPDCISSQIAAIRALRVEDDKSLTQFLTATAAKDQYGGMAISSLPYFNTSMPYLAVPKQQDEFTPEEQVELTSNGVSVLGANRAYSDVILGQVVTTYLTNPAGSSDDSYKYLETVDTASAIREYYYENLRSNYGQHRLTDGDLIPGRAMANETSIRAFCVYLYNKLALETLVQAGQTAKKDFEENLSVEVTVRSGKVTINMAPLLVSQIRTIIGTIQVNFGENL